MRNRGLDKIDLCQILRQNSTVTWDCIIFSQRNILKCLSVFSTSSTFQSLYKVVFLNGHIPASVMFTFVLFTLQFKWQIYNLNWKIEKSVDVVLGIWTQGCRMVGIEDSTGGRLLVSVFMCLIDYPHLSLPLLVQFE